MNHWIFLEFCVRNTAVSKAKTMSTSPQVFVFQDMIV